MNKSILAIRERIIKTRITTLKKRFPDYTPPKDKKENKDRLGKGRNGQ